MCLDSDRELMSKTAIILAAGKGTRMKSDLPKVLHAVAERPMLAWVIDTCRAAGCDRLVVVIGHRADLVREAFAADSADITWIEQREQLGTGHAVMVCADELSPLTGPVLVVAGDGPLVRAETLEALMETHAADGAGIKYFQRVGKRVAIISGRSSPAVTMAAAEGSSGEATRPK